jgi:hypothetical protein
MNNELITQKAKQSKVSEKEMEDVLHAINIKEKISKAELEFATDVLKELAIKTYFSSIGKEYVMNYRPLEQHILLEKHKNNNEIDKIFLN